ncbi:MAG TPA: hypothetical protein VMR44_00740, partial [Thermoanaerobaculia bacterium]|nr:hypothetical protein [Thermoanaerobaculia bacterium]
NLLALPPEDVGALWDRRVGSPEVAAVLARLVAEGKLESELGGSRGKKSSAAKDDLRLSLLVGRERFRGFERELIDKLFYGGREQVTTEKLRNHYRESGFDPVAIVRPAIEERLRGRRETAPGGREAPARWRTAALAFALIALLAAERWLSPASGRLGLVLLASILLWTYPLAAVIAGLSRRHVERLGVWTFAFGAPVLALAAGAARTIFLPEIAGLTQALGLESRAFLAPGIFGALALALAPVMVGLSVTNIATSRETMEAVVLRQRLLQARRYLQSQLRLPDPDLDDAWFPYLLALGLSNDVDRWSVAFGAAGGTTAAAVGALATSGGSASGSGGWTGGGGRFGGAGASVSWAAAATGMAAGVSAPSSSGGGGGGGGGGGSSGGGGGGGW